MIFKFLTKANESIETNFAARALFWRNLKKSMAGQISFVTKIGPLQNFIEKSPQESKAF